MAEETEQEVAETNETANVAEETTETPVAETAPLEAAPVETPAEVVETPAEIVEEVPVVAAKEETVEVAPVKKEETTEVVSKTAADKAGRGNRSEKIGVVSSDKMQKTVVVKVDRLIKHPKYRRYVRQTKKFMAHDDMGAKVGDKVKIMETRPLSARKRWRVIEIVQRAVR